MLLGLPLLRAASKLNTRSPPSGSLRQVGFLLSPGSLRQDADVRSTFRLSDVWWPQSAWIGTLVDPLWNPIMRRSISLTKAGLALLLARPDESIQA